MCEYVSVSVCEDLTVCEIVCECICPESVRV